MSLPKYDDTNLIYTFPETPVSFDVKFFSIQDNIIWHIGYRIDQRQLPPDGKWHTIRIPLSDMQSWGGADIETDQWLATQGNISWEKIRFLELIAVHEDSNVREIYIDSIKIAGP